MKILNIMSVNKINKLDKTDFISIFGNVFEKTEWIAEKTFTFQPFGQLNELTSKMIEIFENSNKEDLLKIFNLHPDLVIEKKMTHDSKKEQNNAQLNKCTDSEFEEFKKLNLNYKEKFNFPFIIAVKGKNKSIILNNFRQRITNNIDIEFEEAKKQVKKIANLRLDEILKNNI